MRPRSRLRDALAWARCEGRAWTQPTVAFLISRLGIFALVLCCAPLIEPVEQPAGHLRGQANLLIDTFGSRWDAEHHVSIAEEGYSLDSHPPTVVFFPLLALMMLALGAILGDVVTAGLLLNHLALLGAGLLLYRLVERERGAAVAGRCVWYLMIFPTAFFGSALYTESLFLLLTIGAFLAARKGAWEYAAPLAALAAMARPVGIILAPSLLIEWWLQRRRATAKAPIWALIAPAAAPIGLAVYMLYLDRAFGDPLAFWHAEAWWGHRFSSPIDLVREALSRPEIGWRAALLAGQREAVGWQAELPQNALMDLGFGLSFLLLGATLLWQRRYSDGLYVLLGTLIPFSTGVLFSLRRYVWPLFPAFVLLAIWGERPWVDRLINALFLMLLGAYVLMFASGYWVA